MTSTDSAATVAWLNSRLVLEIYRVTRALVVDDVVSVTLLAAINNANTSYLDSRPEIAAEYMGVASVDDAMRRPASVSALARSIGVPRETARGKALELQAAGLLKPVSGGYILPARAMRVGPLATAMIGHMGAIDEFVAGLAAVGACDLQADAKVATPCEAVGGGALRLVGAHFLRSLSNVLDIAPDLNLISFYILTTVGHLTGAHYQLDDIEPPKDLFEVPIGSVRGAAVAEHLGMPQETVRRHLKKLVGSGRLVLDSAGYSMRFDGEWRELWRQRQAHALANTRQLIRKLKAVGVLDG
ncbi:hypothetical protein ACO2Q1_12815 [Brevundimonas sp. VNH65]|uniref:hypothetical protein n=1 Tax=Brevundimonas sp. VNH65 TaxID=3400917 RepID=UPI003C0D2D5C